MASPSAVRDFVRRVVRRVVVDADKIDLEMSRSELRGFFTDNQIGTSYRAAVQRQEASSDDIIRLTVEARLKRCGGEMRLVVIPDSSKPSRNHANIEGRCTSSYVERRRVSWGGSEPYGGCEATESQ